jgi:DNA-binding response OmpR family regulator
MWREVPMPKILVVDDDPDVVEAVTAFLERHGFIVKSAANRREGLAAFTRENPDLLILDVMMEEPDDGFALAQELRRSGCQRPIILLTSISRVTGFAYGSDADSVPVDGFLEKPVSPQVLIDKVRALLPKTEG